VPATPTTTPGIALTAVATLPVIVAPGVVGAGAGDAVVVEGPDEDGAVGDVECPPHPTNTPAHANATTQADKARSTLLI
jgi:hypothetical protein